MSSINSVSLTGRLGADPETRYFESGSVVAKFRLALSEFAGGKEITHWVSVEAWGKTAEIAANYLKRGSLVGVSGSLKEESWTNRDGSKASRLVVKADRIHLLGSKAQDEAQPAQPAQTPSLKDCPF
jgi:single-strand DNA-binding protein